MMMMRRKISYRVPPMRESRLWWNRRPPHHHYITTLDGPPHCHPPAPVLRRITPPPPRGWWYVSIPTPRHHHHHINSSNSNKPHWRRGYHPPLPPCPRASRSQTWYVPRNINDALCIPNATMISLDGNIHPKVRWIPRAAVTVEVTSTIPQIIGY